MENSNTKREMYIKVIVSLWILWNAGNSISEYYSSWSFILCMSWLSLIHFILSIQTVLSFLQLILSIVADICSIVLPFFCKLHSNPWVSPCFELTSLYSNACSLTSSFTNEMIESLQTAISTISRDFLFLTISSLPSNKEDLSTGDSVVIVLSLSINWL